MLLNQLFPISTFRIEADVLLKLNNFLIFAQFVIICVCLSTQEIENIFKLLKIYVLLKIGVFFEGFY